MTYILRIYPMYVESMVCAAAGQAHAGVEPRVSCCLLTLLHLQTSSTLYPPHFDTYIELVAMSLLLSLW
jgi:hypothetical protein